MPRTETNTERVARVTAENKGVFPVAACATCGCWTSRGGMSHVSPQCAGPTCWNRT